jgi:hypothetical protein
MKLPAPKFLAKIDAKVQIADGTDENGAPNIDNEFDVKCRHESSNAVIFTKDGREVPLKGKVFIFEKFESFPDDITGFCTIGTIQYDIAHASKKLNPDGSINHIVLELI